MNVISVNYSATTEKVKLTSVYQYDHGLYLHIHGLNAEHNVQVHYAIEGLSKAIRTIPEFKDNAWVSKIPDILLSQINDICVYIYTSTADSGQTVMHLAVPIIKRPKPEDCKISDEEIDAFDQIFASIGEKNVIINKTMLAISQGMEDVETLKNQANSALESANTANKNATNAVNSANSAVNAANDATQKANTAANNANAAIEEANAATEDANLAIERLSGALQETNNAIIITNEVRDEAVKATQNALSATHAANSTNKAVQKQLTLLESMETEATSLNSTEDAQAEIVKTDDSITLKFGIPRGKSGVYVGSETPTDDSITVWIDENGVADEDDIPYKSFHIPVLEFSGDTTGMDKDNYVPLAVTFTDNKYCMALRGRKYYSDIGLTVEAGIAEDNYRASWASDAARSFNIGTTTYYMAVPDCGPFFVVTRSVKCKWQGSSSLWFPKKNYTIKFEDGPFLANEAWGEQTKYCLKANWVDASNIRNLLGAYQWGKTVKSRSSAPDRLKALPNGGAVDGFPIWVVINGKHAGLYTMNIPKDAWLFGMTEEDTNAGFICCEAYWFDKEALGDESDIEIECAIGDEDALLESFNNMIRKLNAVNSTEDLSALEEVLDVDSVVDYILFSVMTCHHDGAVKNLIMATYDGVKWFASAYDMDSIYGNNYDGASYLYPLDAPYVNTMHSFRGGNNKLFRVVTTYYKNKLETRGWENILSNMGHSICKERLYEQIYNLAIKFPKILVNEDYRLWPSRPGTLTNNLDQILTFHRLRWDKFSDSSENNTANLYKQIWG